MRAIRTLRVVSAIEGLSYLVLLFVAMPLKYGFDMPLAVRIVGAGHGWLFVAFVAALLWAMRSRAWNVLETGWLFALSLVPFGFVLIERRLRRELRVSSDAGRHSQHAGSQSKNPA